MKKKREIIFKQYTNNPKPIFRTTYRLTFALNRITYLLIQHYFIRSAASILVVHSLKPFTYPLYCHPQFTDFNYIYTYIAWVSFRRVSFYPQRDSPEVVK